MVTVNEAVRLLDSPRWAVVGQGETTLFSRHSLEELVPIFIQSFSNIQAWQGRKTVLYWVMRYARTHPDVVSIGLVALNDRAVMVRSDACAILAYSLREDVIPNLQALLKHNNKTTRADAAAAIDAIVHTNHHLFVDRNHSGKSFWILNETDEPNK